MTMTTMDQTTLAPVRKLVSVAAGAERAFAVFTAGIDRWWPRSHHIGKLPMRKIILEGRPGGRCYSEQTDGSECDWGQVLVWEPPLRLVFAWMISPRWQHEPDLGGSSEVEVRFIPEADGTTRVELEHRHFERHGEGGAAMRGAIDAAGGWGGLLALYQAAAEAAEPGDAAGSEP
jgi:uncharacterized protein YndB with AHSA1/START domain